MTLARVAHAGARGLSWASLARLQRALYFAWHSEENDEFGADKRFAETLEPILQFLYAIWWRVETTGTEHVPSEGPGLIVANHSGVLPYDGLMVQLAIRHEHPARRTCRMLALDMFALLPVLAPILSKSGSVRANPENAERLLRKGELLGVFPEGVKGVGKYYRDRYRLARFGRGGFVRIALRTGHADRPVRGRRRRGDPPGDGEGRLGGEAARAAVLPAHARRSRGSGRSASCRCRPSGRSTSASRSTSSAYGPEAADDPILVNRISEEVRATIQKMVDGRLARRRSVWFG